MRALPSTLAGWVVLYVFVLAMTIIIAWIVTGKVPPPELTSFVALVVTGFMALVKGDPPREPENSTTKTDSTQDST